MASPSSQPLWFVEILAATVPQFDPLERIPDALIGIEVGRVVGQALQVQPCGRARGEEVLDRLAVVNRRAAPDHQQLAAYLTQELAEESDDRRSAERLGLDMGEEAPVRGDGADGGEVVARERGAQDGRLAARGIRAGRERQEVKGRLVYEEDRALLSPRFA